MQCTYLVEADTKEEAQSKAWEQWQFDKVDDRNERAQNEEPYAYVFKVPEEVV